jgi:isopenicillin-N N-acyltransferase like protein
MQTATIPVFLLHGTPFERGWMHGSALRREIRAGVAQWKREHGPKRMKAAREQARESWALLHARAPKVRAELEGLAAGCDLPALDLYLYSGFEFFGTAPQAGCTALAFDSGQGAIVAQNWDGPPEAARDLALFIHTGPDGFEMAVIATVGMLGWVGCNRHGLAFVNNDMMLDCAPDGLPSQVIRRLILAEPNVDAAVARLAELPHMGGRSYVLGDAQGGTRAVEVSPTLWIRAIEADIVMHTNHALTADAASIENVGDLKATYPSSRLRLQALRRIVGAERTIASTAAALRNTDGLPNAICKSISPEEHTETIFSVIFDCNAREMHLCAGKPDRGTYTTYRLTNPGAAAPNWRRGNREERETDMPQLLPGAA